jgi:hypothetical protein
MKKKGDCIAVQPLDHRTTQHDYEQKGEKTKHPLEQSSADDDDDDDHIVDSLAK